MVGNHDWFFHLRGERFDALRETMAKQMGLSTPPYAPFPHEPWESDELLAALRRHKVFARHGDKYDPFNYEGDRDASSLGDAIVAHVVSHRFHAQRVTGLPLQTAAREIREAATMMLEHGLAAEQLTYIITTLNDALTERIISLTRVRFALPERRWCWLAFGSEGRFTYHCTPHPFMRGTVIVRQR